MTGTPNAHHGSQPSPSSGKTLFITLALSCLVLWGIVLPRIAQWDSVQNRADLYSKAGINPAAIYYTDHPSMQEIEARVKRKLHSNNLSSFDD